MSGQTSFTHTLAGTEARSILPSSTRCCHDFKADRAAHQRSHSSSIKAGRRSAHWKPLPHKSGLWHLTILVEARRQGQPQHTSMEGAEARAAAGAGLPFPSTPFSLATTSHSWKPNPSVFSPAPRAPEDQSRHQMVGAMHNTHCNPVSVRMPQCFCPATASRG